MEFIDLLQSVTEVGVSTSLSVTFIYLLLKYITIKYQEHEIKYEKNKNQLPITVVERLVEAEVWSHSKSKLQMLRSILVINNIQARQEEVKLKIKNMLNRQSRIYIEYFNSLNTPIKNLGDWYSENFDFDEFIEELYLVFFRELKKPGIKTSESWREIDRQAFINEQIEDISNIMVKFQSKTAEKLRKKLRESKVETNKKKTKLFILF